MPSFRKAGAELLELWLSFLYIFRPMEQENRQKLLVKVARTKMPFGRYEGRLLADLPEPYLVWFSQQGFPPGELGEMLALMHEMKVNGLEYLLRPLWPKDYRRPAGR